MDLSKIIQSKGLRFDYVAARLFPKNRYPYNALIRLLNKGELSESQILTLCELLGVTRNDLLGGGERWSGSLGGGALELSRGDYSAIYTAALGVYTLHRKSPGSPNGLQYLGAFAVPLGITVRDFIKTLDDHISKIS